MRILLQIIACVWSLASLCQAAPTRVAVLEIDSPALGKLATLLESELLELPDIELLERAGLQNIIKEQKLQPALTAGANAERMRLAKLLKADVLVLLQAVDKPVSHARLVVFEARQGLRLSFEPFMPAPKVTDDIKKLLPSVKSGLARFREPRREIVAIPSLLDSSLTTENQYLGSTVARLVEQNLLMRPEVLVVELEEAHAVTREAILSGENIEGRMLPLYLLGEYHFAARVENRTVSYKLEVKRGAKVLGQFQNDGVPVEQFVASIQAAAMKLLDKAIGKSAAAIDVEVENMQLLLRAKKFSEISDRRTTLELLEAAIALKPDQPAMHGEASMLIHHIAGRPRDVPDPALAALTPVQRIERGRANAKLRRRATAHAEAFWIGADSEKYEHFRWGHLAEFKAKPEDAEWQHEIDEHRREYLAMAERVLQHKAKHQVHDEALFLFHPYLVPLEFPLNPEWPNEPTTDQKRLQALWDQDLKLFQKFSHLNYRNPSIMRELWRRVLRARFRYDNLKRNPEHDALVEQQIAFLEKVREFDSETLRAEADERIFEFRKFLSETRELPQYPEKTSRDPSDVDVIRHEIKLTELLADGKTKEFVALTKPIQWLNFSPGCDVINYDGNFYWMRSKGELTRITADPLTSADNQSRYMARMASDGRYLWIILPGKSQRLVVVDSQSDGAWQIGAAEGIPPMEATYEGGAALGPYAEGKACVAGFMESRWIGLAKLDPATGLSFDVIHEATKRGTASTLKTTESNPLEAALPVTRMVSISGRQKPDGPLEHRILLQNVPMLEIDPAARTVKDLRKEHGGSIISGVSKNEGDRITGGGMLKLPGGTTINNKLLSYGFPDLQIKNTGKSIPNDRDREEIIIGEYCYSMGNTNEPIEFRGLPNGKFRILREEWANLNEGKHFIKTSHHGTIFSLSDGKLFSWEHVTHKKK